MRSNKLFFLVDENDDVLIAETREEAKEMCKEKTGTVDVYEGDLRYHTVPFEDSEHKENRINIDFYHEDLKNEKSMTFEINTIKK